MRITAGVLMILVAVVNLFSGCAHVGGGMLVSGLGELGEALERAEAPDGSPGVEEAQMVQAVGSGIFTYGLFLLVLAGLNLACAVTLFGAKAAGFAIGVGLLQGVVGVANFVRWANLGVSTPSLLALFSVVAAVLAIAAAAGYAPTAGAEGESS